MSGANVAVSGVHGARAGVMRGFLWVCLGLIAAGEVTIAAGAPFVGLMLEAIAVLLLASPRWHFAPGGTSVPPREIVHACAVVALLPIMRFISVTVPLKRASEIVWYLLIGLPMLVVLIRLMGEEERLRPLLHVRGEYASQLLIATGGVPLGLLAYTLFRPEPLHVGSVMAGIAGFAVLTICSAFVEEMLFRGLLDDVLGRTFGPGVGLFVVSAMFGVFNAIAGGPWFAIFAGAYGLAFGLAVRRTGSLVGVTLAHGLLNTGLIIVWPAVFG